MDVPWFSSARLFPRNLPAVPAAVPSRARRLKVLGRAAAGALLIAGAAAACSSGGGGGGSANSPITICEIAATSGPFSALGTNDELGATAWAAMVNKAGGVQGHQVKLVPETTRRLRRRPRRWCTSACRRTTRTSSSGRRHRDDRRRRPVANQLQTVLLGWGSGWAGQGISAANMTSYAFPGIGNVYFADDQAMITQLIVPRHYTRVAVIQDNTPGGLSNLPYMQSQASKYGYQIVSSQIVNPGSTNDTPQVLNLLKANPQVIVLGLTPGPDTITFLKSMRAQNPTIPIGECSGCATTQFVNAVGGATTMSNIYLIGTPDNVLAAFPSSGANAAGVADTKAYIAAMKAANLGTATQIDEGGEGWDTGRELADAIDSAKSIKSSDVKNALEKQKLTVGGIIMYTWTRSASDHASMTDSGQSAMVTVAADSSFTVLPHVGG